MEQKTIAVTISIHSGAEHFKCYHSLNEPFNKIDILNLAERVHRSITDCIGCFKNPPTEEEMLKHMTKQPIPL